jgi:hypothetical protein
MNCRSCSSANQQQFRSEINVHFPGLQNLDRPTVFAFPKILVCLDCGFTEFLIPENELRRLGEGTAASGIKRSLTTGRSIGLSGFVAELPFGRHESESRECAADKPLALKNSFYRQ